MPRQARFIIPGVPLHVVQRGANRQRCFVADSDFHRYWELLRTHSEATACPIHAYVLMPNHIHLLLTSPTDSAVGGLMKAVGQQYTQYFNRRYRRTGPLWEGRHRTHAVQDEAYLLTCQRYIELNPVRAGICGAPSAYRWSSHRSNAEGSPDSLVSPHSTFLALDANPLQRRAHYRSLFKVPLDQQKVDAIRAATISGRMFGEPGWGLSPDF